MLYEAIQYNCVDHVLHATLILPTSEVASKVNDPRVHLLYLRERNGSKHIVSEAAVVVHVGRIDRSVCTAAGEAFMRGQAAAALDTLRCC
jgi:hypothetical protein